MVSTSNTNNLICQYYQQLCSICYGVLNTVSHAARLSIDPQLVQQLLSADDAFQVTAVRAAAINQSINQSIINPYVP